MRILVVVEYYATVACVLIFPRQTQTIHTRYMQETRWSARRTCARTQGIVSMCMLWGAVVKNGEQWQTLAACLVSIILPAVFGAESTPTVQPRASASYRHRGINIGAAPAQLIDGLPVRASARSA